MHLFLGHIFKGSVRSTGAGMWGGGAQSVDNATAAWGQASDAATGWGDPEEPGKASGWGNPSPNPGKPGKTLNKHNSKDYIVLVFDNTGMLTQHAKS